MEFELTKFLVCRAIAENADPDTPGADRMALVASMLNVGLVQSAVLASVLAEVRRRPSAAPASVTSSGGRARLLGGGQASRQGEGAQRAPHVRSKADRGPSAGTPSAAAVRPRAGPEIKTPRVVRQWPEADKDVDEGAEINVLLLVPEEGKDGAAEPRVPARK